MDHTISCASGIVPWVIYRFPRILEVHLVPDSLQVRKHITAPPVPLLGGPSKKADMDPPSQQGGELEYDTMVLGVYYLRFIYP